MKIFVVLSNFPYSEGEAIEVVSYEIVRLIAGAGHTLQVQVIIRDGKNSYNDERQREAVSNLAHPRISFLNPIYLRDNIREAGPIVRKLRIVENLFRSLPLLRRRINRNLFPATKVSGKVEISVHSYRPDIILSIWSWEALAATYAISSVPKFAYYGNPDHKPLQARLDNPKLFGISTGGPLSNLKLGFLKLLNSASEVQHLRMMRCYQVTANNSLVDAHYYQKAGHPKSIYLQNMWPQAKYPPAYENNVLPLKPIKIVGSVGNLGATGNTFGLYFIGKRLAPVLEKKLGSANFSINIFGGGRANEVVASVLSSPSIKLRGWVDDLQQEIRSSHAFLVLTNVGGFIVGNTRILLAWSLGVCLIAHTNSAISMPEIVHMENALLGDSAEEIAELIIRVIRDPALRSKISRGGVETFNKYYRSEVVVPKMLKEMQDCIYDWQVEQTGGN